MSTVTVFQTEADTTVALPFRRDGTALDLTGYDQVAVRLIPPLSTGNASYLGAGSNSVAAEVVTYTKTIDDFYVDGTWQVQLQAREIATGVVRYSDIITALVTRTVWP